MAKGSITKESGLPKFEGLDVLESQVKITRAGDGLSNELQLDPVAHHHGEEHFYVLRTITEQVNHKPLTKTGTAQRRIHTEPVVEITEVDKEDVVAMLDTARQRVEMAQRERENERRGSTPLPFDPPEGKTWAQVTVAEVMDGVGSDRAKAAQAIIAEEATDKPRQGLLKRLQAIQDGDEE